MRNRIRFETRSGVTISALNKIDSTAISAFSCLIDSSMCEEIITCTNQYSDFLNKSYKLNRRDLINFIGVLYSRGLYAGGIPVKNLWSREHGHPSIKSLMSKPKFEIIMQLLRFDNRETREFRLLTDKFALIRSIWDQFVNNCMSSYYPGQYLTIDEQLLPSKTRSPKGLIQFMPNKPDKFGVKIWMICDLESKYVLNLRPYLGACLQEHDSQGSDLLGENIVKRLSEFCYFKGHNITCDNYFTTYNLAMHLFEKKTTLIGTIKKNKRELHSSVKINKPVGTTDFFDNEKGVLFTIFQCKKKKNVTLISTLHEKAEVTDHKSKENKRKPSTIHTYNYTKCGVDSVDQMTRVYSVKYPTRRWPLQIFYNMLNLTSINAWILFKKVNNTKISRRDFLTKLVDEIISLNENNLDFDNKVRREIRKPNYVFKR
jgi:hypothetical protein